MTDHTCMATTGLPLSLNTVQVLQLKDELIVLFKQVKVPPVLWGETHCEVTEYKDSWLLSPSPSLSLSVSLSLRLSVCLSLPLSSLSPSTRSQQQ